MSEQDVEIVRRMYDAFNRGHAAQAASWTVRDGKAFRCEVYSDRGHAARATGLPE